MANRNPPTAEQLVRLDEDELSEVFVWVDHREEESSIVAGIAEQVAPARRLLMEDVEEAADGSVSLRVQLDGAPHRIAMTLSPCDRYVAISSLAWLLRDSHRFYVARGSLDGDTQALLALPHAEVEALRRDHLAWLEDALEAVELGVDYFHGGVRVPHLGDPESYARFADDGRERVAGRTEAEALFQGLLPGEPQAAKPRPWWKFW